MEWWNGGMTEGQDGRKSLEILKDGIKFAGA